MESMPHRLVAQRVAIAFSTIVYRANHMENNIYMKALRVLNSLRRRWINFYITPLQLKKQESVVEEVHASKVNFDLQKPTQRWKVHTVYRML